MKPGTVITSMHNPKIKSLLSLEKARERKKQGLFIVEGDKEIRMALEGGYRIGNLFYCDEIIARDKLDAFLTQDKLLIPVTREVFEKIAVRENSGGMIAVAEQKVHRLDQLHLSPTPLIIVLESVEKPGNLGAILRTADAGGIDAVIICDPQTDFYNPNVIRSSVGCVFSVPTATASSEQAISWLRDHHIRIYSTYVTSSQPYTNADYLHACAIVMGTEATGLSDQWVEHADATIRIPMGGKNDSLNVSTATAVVVFEARRQRGFS